MDEHGLQFKVRVGKQFPKTFEINNGLKQEDALSPQLFNTALEPITSKMQESKQRLRYSIEKGGLLLALRNVGLRGNISKSGSRRKQIR